MKKLLVITLCIIILVFSACSGNNEKFEAKLSEQEEVSKVKLTELTDFKWDKNSDQRDQIKTGQREFVGAAADKQQPVARGGGCRGLLGHGWLPIASVRE